MQANKNGFFYVIDRTNGKLISAKAFVPDVTLGHAASTRRPAGRSRTRRPLRQPA